MKKKGFTLIELLVVIAIIAMLLAILMPALNKVKKIAQRVVCGTNLKGLGTAHIVYANDYEDDFVIQGGGFTHAWEYNTGGWQSDVPVWDKQLPITVGASLYLLVREADVSPKSFVCGGGGQQEFDGENAMSLDIVELYDFGHTDNGDGPRNCCSYSYHLPYRGDGGPNRNAADGTRSAAFAVMADKNPWMDPKLQAADTLDIDEDTWSEGIIRMERYWDVPAIPESHWSVKVANAYPHGRDGQNVLFGDGHTAYEKTPDVGVRHDGIYVRQGGQGDTEDQIRRGQAGATFYVVGSLDSIQVSSGEDSLLVNDDDRQY
jgi:prepilin-type N-terminal cleavage/methylation domain-containing protein/prepilin-type processing-associated H-X9-DG protein